MNRRPSTAIEILQRTETPEHAPEFWDGLMDRLGEEPVGEANVIPVSRSGHRLAYGLTIAAAVALLAIAASVFGPLTRRPNVTVDPAQPPLVQADPALQVEVPTTSTTPTTALLTSGESVAAEPVPPSTTTPPPSAAWLHDIAIIDGDSENVVGHLFNATLAVDGYVVDRSTITSGLNLRAMGQETAAVRFVLTGAETLSTYDDRRPYVVTGSSDPWTPVDGDYRLSVTPYDENGLPGPEVVIEFSVINGPDDQ